MFGTESKNTAAGMAGITHGVLTGVLVTSGLAYLTARQFENNAGTIKREIGQCIDIAEHKQEAVPHVSNVRTYYSSSVVEGAKDLWNEEVIGAVNWWYGLKVGSRLMAAISDAFK